MYSYETVEKTLSKNCLRARGDPVVIFCSSGDKTTTTGPHRDRIVFNWDNNNTRTHCSQGENKTYLVLLKLAELQYLMNETKKPLIFMMDDLFATLDFEKSKRTVEVLSELNKNAPNNFQTIITNTDIINLEKNGIFGKNLKHKTHHLKG